MTYYLDDEPEPAFFQVMITAPAADLELFLLPYIDTEQADLEVEILNIVQPVIGEHDENLKWLDYLMETPARKPHAGRKRSLTSKMES